MNSKKIYIFLCFCFQTFLLSGQIDSSATNPINDDTYLHPVDGITPYTLKKGEWFYAQPLLPAPGWAFVGLTDNLTLQLDFTPLIGGIFIEPHYPIPSVSLRYKIANQKKILPAFSIEGQFFHLWDTLKRYDVNDYSLYQKGTYFHLKTMYGYQFNSLYINWSAGFDYMEKMWWKKDSAATDELTPNVNPNFSAGISWRPSKWISYHIAFSYGATLTYLENTPRKTQFNYGMRIAPFYKNKWRLLRNLRIEFISINAWFADINEYSGIPLPIYPLFY